MTEQTDKKLTAEALKLAAKEVAAFRKAVVAEQKDEHCNGLTSPAHNDLVRDRYMARQVLDAKIDGFLQSKGVNTDAPKTQHGPDGHGYLLKNDMISHIENVAQGQTQIQFADGHKSKGCKTR